MSTVGNDMKSTENIELHLVRQHSREYALSSKDDIEDEVSRIEDGSESDGAIADQISPLKGQGSDSIKDHGDVELITKGNILFIKPFCIICLI